MATNGSTPTAFLHTTTTDAQLISGAVPAPPENTIPSYASLGFADQAVHDSTHVASTPQPQSQSINGLYSAQHENFEINNTLLEEKKLQEQMDILNLESQSRSGEAAKSDAARVLADLQSGKEITMPLESNAVDESTQTKSNQGNEVGFLNAFLYCRST